MTEKERRQARIDALSDHQRRLLLAYLCGLMPQVIDGALDEFARLHYGQPAAPATEDSHD